MSQLKYVTDLSCCIKKASVHRENLQSDDDHDARRTPSSPNELLLPWTVLARRPYSCRWLERCIPFYTRHSTFVTIARDTTAVAPWSSARGASEGAVAAATTLHTLNQLFHILLHLGLLFFLESNSGSSSILAPGFSAWPKPPNRDSGLFIGS